MSEPVRFVKNGIYRHGAERSTLRKPEWLKVAVPGGEGYSRVRSIVADHQLHTVCQEAMCPNIAECWTAGTATLMLMGHICTRACRFCAVDTGNPKGLLDPAEPESAARSVELMGLRYVVLTSVDRDDLQDGGAAHFAATIRAIKARNPETKVEALTPDFSGRLRDAETVLDSGADVFAQNVETVERLTHPVRDIRAGYRQTLGVLAHAKQYRGEIYTKTSLMVGLGETKEELVSAMRDLRDCAVDIVTFGQYLQPTRSHLPVARYWTPEEFAELREAGMGLGFLEVVAGPLVRSSYRAERVLANHPGEPPRPASS
jgi:lipoic acid synthetase